MPYITAPPGCRQLAFADGGKPVRVDRRGRAYVSDERARMIDSMRGNGEGGLIHGQPGEYLKTAKTGPVVHRVHAGAAMERMECDLPAVRRSDDLRRRNGMRTTWRITAVAAR